MRKQPWKRTRVPEAARQARTELVDTIKSTIAKNIEDGNSRAITAGKLGLVTVQRGLTLPGTLHVSALVVVGLVDRRQAGGERIVNIYHRIGSMSVTHAQIPIDPFEPNLFLLKETPSSAIDDRVLAHRIQGVIYSADGARHACEQLLQTPETFGIPSKDLYG